MSDDLRIRFTADMGDLATGIEKAKSSIGSVSTTAASLKTTFADLSTQQTAFSKTFDTLAAGFSKAQVAADTLNDHLQKLKTVGASAITQFQQGQSASIGDLAQQITQAGSISKFAAISGGLIGITALATGFAFAETKVLAALQDTADEARVTAVQVNALQTIFAKLGLSTDQTTKLLITFANRLLDAKAHGGDLATSLQSLGIAITNADGSLRPTIDVLQDLVRHMRDSSDEAGRMKLATQAVGDELAGPFANAVKTGGAAMDNLQATSSRVTSAIISDFGIMAQEAMRWLNLLAGRMDSLYSRLKEMMGLQLTSVDRKNVAEEHMTEAQGALVGLQLASNLRDVDPSEVKKAWQRIFDAGKEVADANPIPVLAGGDPREKPAAAKAAADVTAKSDATDSGRGRGASGDQDDEDKSAEVIQRLQEELQLAQTTGEAHQAILDKIRTENDLKRAGVSLDSQAGQQIASLVRQTSEAAEATKALREAFDRVGQAISSSVMSMLEGSANIKSLLANVAKSLVQSFIEARVKSTVDWATGMAQKVTLTTAGEGTMTAATLAGEAARTGAVEASAATAVGAKLAAVFKSIASSAAETFAGVFAFFSPTLGPFAAAPAAAAAATVGAARGLVSFDVGSWSLPDDMVAQVHRGEMIVPAQATPWAQSLMANAAGGGRSSSSGPAADGGGDTDRGMKSAFARNGGGDFHLHIETSDTQSLERWARGRGRELLKGLHAAHRQGASLGLRFR